MGIDIGPDGVTSNDPGDVDTGANNLQNFPVLTAAFIGGEDFQITGTVNFYRLTNFEVHFYSNSSCDSSGNGEGQTWMGSTVIAYNASGVVNFTVSTIGDDIRTPQTPVGSFVTATVLQGDSNSEFSACIEASALPQLDLPMVPVTVAEGGTAHYSVALTAAPASDVTVSLVSSDRAVATVLPSSMTFTASNWHVAQLATVTGVGDADPVNAQTDVSHSIAVGGNTFPGRSVSVDVTDDDTPDLMVWGETYLEGTQYDKKVILPEGETVTYEAVLTKQPATDVTVAADFDRHVKVEPASLTFTTMNWDTPQTVMLTAINSIEPTDRVSTYTHEVEIDGATYVVAQVTVLVKDTDQPKLTLSHHSVSVNEGQTATYTVALAAQPANTATIFLLSGDAKAAQPWPKHLTFNADNWDTPQTVTVNGALDADGRDETVRIYHLRRLYIEVPKNDIAVLDILTVSVTDQDLPELRLARDSLTIRDSTATIDIVEGGSADYTLELAEQPTADLTVTVSTSDIGLLMAVPSSLTFTSNTWNVPQTVTLTAVVDSDDWDESVEVRHRAVIGSESYLLATLTAEVSDSTNTSLTPPVTDPVAVRSTADYNIRFWGRWDQSVTPPQRPSDAHFSRLIGAVHSADVSFVKAGEMASAGVEAMAETGATSLLRSEIAREINAAQGGALSVLEGPGSILNPLDPWNLSSVTLTTDHPRVTLLSMIAPSPDWFVGVAGLPLLDADGNWMESLEVNLYPWDAGTEEGTEFSSSNNPTSPQGVITNLRAQGRFTSTKIALLRFTLHAVNTLATGTPSVIGLAEAGEGLTANTSGIVDADGLTSPGYVYQWVSVASGGVETDIPGATSSTYTAQAGDVDSQLKVRVSFTDDKGNAESLTSHTTAAVIVAQVTVRFGATVYSAREGGAAATVTVVLDKDPYRALTIPLTNTPRGGAVAADYRALAEVVINTGELSKEVAVTASDDEVDDDGESVELAFGMLPDGVSVGSPASAVVELTDNDTAGVTLDKAELVVAESGSATYTVALDTEPTADVTVTITGQAGTDLTLTPATAMLTFTPFTWGRTQTVTVAAGDDGDALNDSALLTHRAGGATEYASVTASLSVTVTDDDTKATGAPTINGTAEVGEELTANTSGIADADGLNNVSYVYQWVRVASGGGESAIPGATLAGYTLAVGDVGDAFKLRVTFTDDKGNPESLTSAPTAVVTVAQVRVSFGLAAYGAAEGGPAAEVQIVLDKDPHRRVRIRLTVTPSGGADPGDYGAPPAQVVFNAGETSKDVTITAVDDSVDDDGESVELTFGMLPAGMSEGTTNRAVVQITDNDGKGIVLSPTSLGVSEGGSTPYTVALASQPTADVAVTIMGHSGTDLGLSRTSLTFTTTNWNSEQSVTASAAHDGDSDDDSATLTHAASGGGYAGVTAVLAVTVADDDMKATGAPIIDGLPEVGETLTVDTSQIMDADGLSRPGYRYQWVRVASGGAETDIPRATSATYRVIGDDVGAALKVEAAFTDNKSNPESAESAASAEVTVAQVVASFGSGPYVAEEGRSVRVRVTLDKNPLRTVTIPLTAAPLEGADPGDYRVPIEVVFNVGETFKDVTITAVDDSVDDDGESVEVTFGTLPDGVSEGATILAVVRITDNDGRGIALSSTSLSVTEGGTARTYTVALATQPAATVTVTITGHSGTDVSLDNTVLFFTPSDWNSAQTIMVSADQDPDFNNDSATLTHTASGADYDSVESAVTVTVVDDDRVQPPVTTGGGGGFGPAPVAPKFSDGFRTARTVATNARPGDAVGEPVSATHPDELEIAYSLSGTDASLFTVDEETGQIHVKEMMDLTIGKTYTVNLTATDSAGFGAIIIVMIEISEASFSPYDRNGNENIERDEVIMAVKHYFDGLITKNDIIELIKLYFQGNG